MKKKKFFVSLISTLLFLIFLSIMDYPFLARMFNERNQGAVVVDYEETLGKRSDPEKERMLEEARKYNSSLASGLGNALEETCLLYTSEDVRAAVDAAKEKLLAGEVTVDTAFGMDEAKLKEIIGSAQ